MEDKNSEVPDGDVSTSANAPLNQLSVGDALADARREWRYLHSYVFPVGGIVWLVAMFKLRDPDLAESARTFWTYLPFPFLALGLWATFARDRRLDELSRAIEREAAHFAMSLTMAWALGMMLLIASGFLVPSEFIVFWPILFNSFGWTRARRRLGLP